MHVLAPESRIRFASTHPRLSIFNGEILNFLFHFDPSIAVAVCTSLNSSTEQWKTFSSRTLLLFRPHPFCHLNRPKRICIFSRHRCCCFHRSSHRHGFREQGRKGGLAGSTEWSLSLSIRQSLWWLMTAADPCAAAGPRPGVFVFFLSLDGEMTFLRRRLYGEKD